MSFTDYWDLKYGPILIINIFEDRTIYQHLIIAKLPKIDLKGRNLKADTLFSHPNKFNSFMVIP